MNKRILGLDLGTNSIGWALIEQNFEEKQGKILGMGSRIIPMSQDILNEFGNGSSISQTAERTRYRSARRLRERHLLRRERLHRVLNILGFLPQHYTQQIDFEKHFGKFLDETEPKLAYNEKQFVFKKSFNEMLDDFREKQPELLNRKNRKGENAKVPYDWTIYYLRKKALSHKIEKEELAWIILNFNQKRGYYQLRGEEEEENPNKLVEFYTLRIADVVADEKPNNKGETWYSIVLENGWVYRRSSKTPLFDWKDKVRDFIVTTDLNDDGTVKIDKEGEEKRSFRAPKEDDWTLLKKKTEQEIDKSEKTVGTYIYDALLQNPTQKIRGKLVRTIERKFYKKELKLILQKQIELQPELFTDDLYNDCIRELYKHNDAHQLTLSERDFTHLFLEDIIFYQRPLRSQKSSIGNCSLEFREYKDKEGNKQTQYIKSIPKSSPYYQEFRIWQWLQNLKIYKKENDIDVTQEFIHGIEGLENLFEFLMSQKEVDHKSILRYLITPKELKGKALHVEIGKYRWNYVYDSEKDESKKYPMNTTRYEIKRRLEKMETIPADFLTREREQKLWHIIYSVTDKIEFEKALSSFANRYGLDQDSFVENFKKFPPFTSEYGSYSEKAIKKLLPFLRLGKYWDWDSIDDKTKSRIDKILNGEYDEQIKNRVREKTIHLTTKNDFQGLPLWLAQYIVYDRHSEVSIAEKWSSVSHLEEYLKNFRQHTLRNPIVEQVITEILRVVKEIWIKYGNRTENYFNEIHIELGREMKNTAEERKRLTNIISENENTNLRIKALLMEMMDDEKIENVKPYSPSQQEILKIYEDGVLNASVDIDEDILKISKKAEPTKSELQRYKLWLEQKYRSPYTGQIIPLNKLFTPEYEIEHIIPQSRFFDDSFNNKVICEAAVNKKKDKQLGLEFIKNHYGEKIQTNSGKEVPILTEDRYIQFVKENYAKNRNKRNKLLLEDIPEKMVERQLNDTRYISKHISSVLSNLVRADQKDDGFNSKNLLPGNGKITTELKQDWGLNDVWNNLILPRFERMNQITQTNLFTSYSEKQQKIIPAVPFEYSKGFQKKRIDHRHHALDALVIACATRNHINYMNNQHALEKGKTKQEKQNKREDLRAILCYKKYNEGSDKNYRWIFKKPWENFTVDATSCLEKIVVSFKQNLRVINKATNKHEKWVEEKGKKVKILVEQKGINWAIRKPMHKETVYGEVELSRIKPKGKILTATRKSIDSSFDLKMIERITDTGIQKILRNYLTQEKFKIINTKGEISYNTELAFSAEGLEDMNQNIFRFNDGKPHQAIFKARIFELGSKFPVGQKGNKKAKYVEAAKGTNLFFAIYQDENGKRNYETIPLNVIIERQKQGLKPVPEQNEKGDILLFDLSPNDLVYVPTKDEEISSEKIDFINLNSKQVKRIYKTVSSSGNQCFFIKQEIAKVIVNKNEYSTLNKMEKTIDDIMIKEYCIKLKVDRLGNISKA